MTAEALLHVGGRREPAAGGGTYDVASPASGAELKNVFISDQ